MSHRNVLLGFFLFLIPCVVSAKSFIGTMTVGESFSLSDIRVELADNGDLLLYDVKFARLMPLRVDVVLPQPQVVEEADGKVVISGDSIIPLVDDKPYPSKIATNLLGVVQYDAISFSALFGGKPLKYVGKMVNP